MPRKHLETLDLRCELDPRSRDLQVQEALLSRHDRDVAVNTRQRVHQRLHKSCLSLLLVSDMSSLTTVTPLGEKKEDRKAEYVGTSGPAQPLLSKLYRVSNVLRYHVLITQAMSSDVPLAVVQGLPAAALLALDVQIEGACLVRLHML